MNKLSRNDAAGRLRAFLDRLKFTYRTRGPGAEDRRHLSLALAVTGLDDWWIGQGRVRPLQVAVIGPTQVGKSTVVNLLLGTEQAEASALAAHTRQLYGFTTRSAESEYNWIKQILGDAVLTLRSAERPQAIDSVVWDTPDFDSHRSHGYRELIAQVAALADVFLLVVSKEKYADLSVWETLNLIRPLQRPLFICLNKVAVSEQQILERALSDRLRELGWGMEEVPVFVLPYIGTKHVFAAMAQTKTVTMLRARIFDLTLGCSDRCRLQGVQRIVAGNWEDWVHPVKEEIEAVGGWRREIVECQQNALIDYRAQYLDHAHHDDAFKQTILQLLELLEIPGVGDALSKLRRVLTWPVRKVLNSWQYGGRGEAREPTEKVILGDIADHALLTLHGVVSEHQAEQGQSGLWWETLHHTYKIKADQIRRDFPQAVSEYQKTFAPEIEKAAHSIHIRLKDNPVVLNTLRATRLSADLAGVAVAIKTGAIGVSEALLTPAMLSLTSILTESAVGTYVDSVHNNLKEKQYELVETLFHEQFSTPLRNIRLEGSGLFHISKARLERTEAIKKELFQ